MMLAGAGARRHLSLLLGPGEAGSGYEGQWETAERRELGAGCGQRLEWAWGTQGTGSSEASSLRWVSLLSSSTG